MSLLWKFKQIKTVAFPPHHTDILVNRLENAQEVKFWHPNKLDLKEGSPREAISWTLMQMKGDSSLVVGSSSVGMTEAVSVLMGSADINPTEKQRN